MFRPVTGIQCRRRAQAWDVCELEVVSHSAHEFTLDFCQVLPSGEDEAVTTDVVSRLKVVPTMVGRVIRALNTNMTVYEDRFGLVKAIG